MNFALTGGNLLVSFVIGPLIYRPSLEEAVNHEDEAAVKSLASRYRCRAGFEMCWVCIFLLCAMFLAVYSIFGLVYLCSINFVGSFWFGFSMITAVCLNLIFGLP